MDLISFGTYDVDAENEEPVNQTDKHAFWRFTLYDILTLVCAASVPIALAIYTVISTQEQDKEAAEKREFDLKQADELRQQSLYQDFLKTMYNLDKDGYLDINDNPWIFANAYYRATHRQWDTTRKEDALQFLKEKQLIGVAKSVQTRLQTPAQDMIFLHRLSFDGVTLKSQTGSLNQLDLRNIVFDQVSMLNANFSFVDLEGSSFSHARLNHTHFQDSSLASTIFDGTDLQDTDFGNSNLRGAQFLNVDLTNTKLSANQIQQAVFVNATFSNGTVVQSSTTITTRITTTKTTITTTTTTTTTTTPQQTTVTQTNLTTQNNLSPSANINRSSTAQSTQSPLTTENTQETTMHSTENLTTENLRHTTIGSMQSSSREFLETTTAEGSGFLPMDDFDYVLAQRLVFPYVQDSASTTTKSIEFLTADNYRSLLANKKDLTCADIPCRNAGTCVDTNNGGAYVCQCTSQYHGDNCENSL